MAVPQTTIRHKDFPGGLEGNRILTNEGKSIFVTRLGTRILPGASVTVSDFEYLETVASLTKNKHSLAGVGVKASTAGAPEELTPEQEELDTQIA